MQCNDFFHGLCFCPLQTVEETVSQEEARSQERLDRVFRQLKENSREREDTAEDPSESQTYVIKATQALASSRSDDKASSNSSGDQMTKAPGETSRNKDSEAQSHKGTLVTAPSPTHSCSVDKSDPTKDPFRVMMEKA